MKKRIIKVTFVAVVAMIGLLMFLMPTRLKLCLILLWPMWKHWHIMLKVNLGIMNVKLLLMHNTV